MRKILFLLIALLFLVCSCSKKKFEYKIVRVTDSYDFFDPPTYKAQMAVDFGDQSELLNRMAAENWELVDVYTETSTLYPNFGEPKYHTGIKSNVHTSALNFIFKREKNSEETAKTPEQRQEERDAEIVKAFREGDAVGAETIKIK